MKNKPTIFVVEDDNFYNSVLTTYLKTKGFEVYSFLSGEECLEKCSIAPNIVLLDYILTGIDGLEVMRRMKELSPGTQFIFLSGQTDIKVVLSALHEGAYDYIIKDAHAKENALIKIDQIARYNKVNKEKEMYRKSIVIVLAVLLFSWILVFSYYMFHK
jgi:Response regulator containing CheY-like receiver, AAA-type ATPase, and DNA-binding domains